MIKSPRTSWDVILDDEWPPPVAESDLPSEQAGLGLGPLVELTILVPGGMRTAEECFPVPHGAVVEHVYSSRERLSLEQWVYPLLGDTNTTSYYRVVGDRLYVIPASRLPQTLTVGYRLPAGQEVPGPTPRDDGESVRLLDGEGIRGGRGGDIVLQPGTGGRNGPRRSGVEGEDGSSRGDYRLPADQEVPGSYTPLAQGVNELLAQVRAAHARVNQQANLDLGQLPTSPATRTLRDIYTQERIESLAFDSPLLRLVETQTTFSAPPSRNLNQSPRSPEELDALPGRNNVFPQPEVAIGHTERMFSCQRTLETLDRLLAPSWDRVWTGQETNVSEVQVLVEQLHTLRADLQRWLRLEEAERTARVP